MNELPNSYKRYKGLTGYFEKWLINVAKERGLEIAHQVEAAAAKRENAGGSKSRHILTRDLLPMARAVANSGQPSEDTSGLADLDGAIRIRKEVTQWYRLQHVADQEHTYFISLLTDVRQVFKDWIFVTPTQPEVSKNDKETQGNNKKNFFEKIEVIFGRSDDVADTEDSIEESAGSSSEAEADKRSTSRSAPHAKSHVRSSEIDREFEVLCFLYDLYLLRQRIKNVWSDWSKRQVGTMTAAIVSDLAMSHIQQRAKNLAKDLEDDGNKQDIIGIVAKLMEMIPKDLRDVVLSDEGTESKVFARDVLCHDGIRTMDQYWRLGAAGVAATHGLPRQDSFRLRFLLHFKVISAGRLEASAMDKFTESLCSPDPQTKVWLPFGFQVLLDIQQLILLQDKTMGELRDDVLDHGVYIAEVMKQQIDYEDTMCAIGEKPGYMSKADFKFSNTYLPTLVRLLDWRLQLQEDHCDPVSKMRNLPFVAAHPIFCGLTMWFYHRSYHATAIRTICWFMVGLAHIYNACRQVGGLMSPWPDLEFVIQSQGPSRIFVGGPPTDPDTFYHRIRLALGSSARENASDYYWHQHRPSRPSRWRRRGLASYPPLEAKIVAYYQANPQEKRSSLLHNIFAFLYQDLKSTTATGASTSKSAQSLKTSPVQEKIRAIFTAIAIKRALRTKNKGSRRKHKSKIPEFSEQDSVHEESLGHAASQLAEHELYANFDHFAFFRRAYEVMELIRTEILWDEEKALMTLDAKQEAPNDLQLLIDLLFKLAPPQDKKNLKHVERYALGMLQLKTIATFMQDFIQDQGDLELKNAQEQMKRRREHGTIPREKLPSESVDEETGPEIKFQLDPILEIEAKPVNNAPLVFPAEAKDSVTKLPGVSPPSLFGTQPVQCGTGLPGSIPSSVLGSKSTLIGTGLPGSFPLPGSAPVFPFGSQVAMTVPEHLLPSPYSLSANQAIQFSEPSGFRPEPTQSGQQDNKPSPAEDLEESSYDLGGVVPCSSNVDNSIALLDPLGRLPNMEYSKSDDITFPLQVGAVKPNRKFLSPKSRKPEAIAAKAKARKPFVTTVKRSPNGPGNARFMQQSLSSMPKGAEEAAAKAEVANPSVGTVVPNLDGSETATSFEQFLSRKLRKTEEAVATSKAATPFVSIAERNPSGPETMSLFKQFLSVNRYRYEGAADMPDWIHEFLNGDCDKNRVPVVKTEATDPSYTSGTRPDEFKAVAEKVEAEKTETPRTGGHKIEADSPFSKFATMSEEANPLPKTEAVPESAVASIEPRPHEAGLSAPSDDRNTCQIEGNATVAGKPFGSHSRMSAPQAVNAAAQTANIKSTWAREAESPSPKHSSVKLPTRNKPPSVFDDFFLTSFTPSPANPFLGLQSTVEDCPPGPLSLEPSTDHASVKHGQSTVEDCPPSPSPSGGPNDHASGGNSQGIMEDCPSSPSPLEPPTDHVSGEHSRNTVENCCSRPSYPEVPTDHAFGEFRYLFSPIDVWHRFTYRSTRSTRAPKSIASARLGRLVARNRSAAGPQRRLVGAVKHRVNHICYGRCMVGHALLGEMHDAWWHGAIPMDDGWETDNEV